VLFRLRAVLAAFVSLAFVLEVPAPIAGGGAMWLPALAQTAPAHPLARVMLPEPPRRTPLPALVPSSVRAAVTSSVRSTHGLPLAGPPMLKPPFRIPAGIGRVASSSRAGTGKGTTVGRPLPRTVRGTMATPAASYGAGTGINPWWHYREETVPGGGHVMVNVGTGNVVLQEDDMEVAHQGIALAYRRTYNLQSGHDVSGSDGSWPTVQGNGWTSTWDAHLSGDPSKAITVWDIDGARYAYTLAADGVSWVAPAGQHATLTSDGNCGMLWTKKSGTIYYFYALAGTSACTNSSAQYGGYDGRLYQLVGRNQNTWLSFLYTWDNGNAGPAGKIANITARAESGMQATLVLADFNGHRLAQSLSRPDGVAIYYQYDENGNLTAVSRPPNSTGGANVYHGFGYGNSSNGAPYLVWVSSPRWTGSSANDGSYLYLGVQPVGSGVSLSSLGHVGWINPTISDGVSSGYVQPSGPNGSVQFSFESYVLGALGSASTATLRDTDGHATNWVTDAAGRVTQTQQCTAAQNQQCSGLWLVSGESWDANDNRLAEIDARGYETDYAYDANGNTVAVGEPPVTVQTANGTQVIRPTQLYSYDGFNNVRSYCDQTWSQAHGRDWDVTGTPSSSGSLCPTAAGSAGQPSGTVMTYAYPTAEPYGELTSIVTPMGYQRTISYTQSGTDYGLPVAVVGTGVTQVDGHTALQENESFGYDGSGNLVGYGTGNGTWNLAYDSVNRLTAATDPDGHASYTYYFPNGAVSKTETPAQHAANAAGTYSFDAGVQHTYDLDGDELTQVHHHGNVTGTTQNWYDGADRLVEVALPGDGSSSAVYTRYLYDLTQGGTVAVGGMSVRAYGNLYDTQEYTTNAATTQPAYVDVRGQAFDALDRLVGKITFPPNADTTPVQAVSSYDASSATLGLLSSTADAAGETSAMSYDALGRRTGITFGNDGGTTPARTYAYDPNGRQATVTSAAFGTQTWGYDADGRLTSVSELSGGGLTSPAVIGYDYYPDGLRKDLTVRSSALTAQPLMTYLYRADGRRTGLNFFYGGTTYPFSWTYSNGGRQSTQTDPFTGRAVPHTASYTPPTATYGAKRWSYDANGDLQSLVLPVVGTYTQMTHDLEGALAAYSVQPSQPVPPAPAGSVYTFNLGVNVAGETTAETIANPSPMAATQVSSFSYKNGHAIPYPGNLSGYPHSGSQTYELIAGVRTALQTWTKNSGNLQCPNPNLVRDSYDNAGRHRATSNTSYDIDCTQSSYTDTTTYDAENHPVQALQTGAVPSDDGATESWGLQWGPNGHPIALQYSPNSTTLTNPSTTYLHYDGDTVLFTTNGSGQLVDVRAELLAVDNFGTVLGAGPLAGFSVQDRDYAQLNVSYHSATGYSALDYGGGPFHDGKVTTATSVYEPGSDGSQPVTGNDNGQPEPTLQYTHPDGFYTPLGRIQGVRAMDTDLGTWKTPDAYAGDVRDPMSQKPYMWNGNNPFEYEDPSGYAPDGDILRRSGTELVKILAKSIGQRGYSEAEQALFRAIIGVTNPKPFTDDPNKLNHMFGTNNTGHVPDTSLNRALIQAVASDNKYKSAPGFNVEGGVVSTFAATLPSGMEVWATVYNDIIQNGGIRQHDPKKPMSPPLAK
jgi:YD repeat-containing protein